MTTIFSLKCKLFDFARPSSKLFEPRNYHPPLVPPTTTPSTTTSTTTTTAGSSTFFDWDSPLNSSSRTPRNPLSPSNEPCWDPSSRTPNPQLDPPDSSSCAAQEQGDRHALLDARLVGMQLKVVVDGGTFRKKEMVASVVSSDGALCIRYNNYKTSASLNTDWVTPKNPNPTRDNGPLVVIRGEHCGKAVRRIHHRYEDDVAILRLAVVGRREGIAENLTGEELEMVAEDLCLGSETTEEKKRIDSLMIPLRNQARKTRAK
jgi:hypothetical protein